MTLPPLGSIVSPKFSALKAEIDQLRNDLLPSPFSPTGSYPNQYQASTQAYAYRILAHALIESYMEERVWDVMSAAIQKWNSSETPSRVLITMLAYSGILMQAPPESMPGPSVSRQAQQQWNDEHTLAGKLKAVQTQLGHRMHQNNGVKIKDILDLFLPVGIEANWLDTLWLSEMNQFGEQRGAVAHKSGWAYRTTQLADPKTEYDKVVALLPPLERLDLILTAITP